MPSPRPLTGPSPVPSPARFAAASPSRVHVRLHLSMQRNTVAIAGDTLAQVRECRALLQGLANRAGARQGVSREQVLRVALDRLARHLRAEARRFGVTPSDMAASPSRRPLTSEFVRVRAAAPGVTRL